MNDGSVQVLHRVCQRRNDDKDGNDDSDDSDENENKQDDEIHASDVNDFIDPDRTSPRP